MAEPFKVCALGDFTSQLAACYLDHIAGVEWEDSAGSAGRGVSLKEQLRRALNAANLPVTTNIICNLLKGIEAHQKERNKAEGFVASTLPSWGQFCACCIALQAHYTSSLQPTPSTGPKRQHLPSYRPSPTCKHEVFLGGSCNPTTWRLDTAIPALQHASITYFNPQVEEWYPELIEVEEQAKTAATLLLFVIDNQTRATSSMVEVAYLAGQGKDLIVQVEDIEKGAVIAGEALSSREIEDLNRGRLFTRNILEEGGCLLADSLNSALDCSIQVVKDKIRVNEYCSRYASRKLHSVPPSLGEELDLLYRVFTMYDNDKKNKLTLNEAELALRSLHIEGPSLQQLLVEQDTPTSFTPTPGSCDLWQQYKKNGLNFDEFCVIYAELKYILLKSTSSSVSMLTQLISTPLKWITNWFWSVPLTTPTHSAPFVDVFLNGSCGKTTWRADISIPILKQYGVSYFNPQVSNWDRRLLPIEREAKERCSILLYVITGETLSVASMVEAAYYIGKGRSVVLCVSDIPTQEEGCTVEGMQLSPHAVKDYNRGRAYLTTMGNKSRVAVYNNVAAATMSAVHMALCVRGQKVQQQHSILLPTSHTSSV